MKIFTAIVLVSLCMCDVQAKFITTLSDSLFQILPLETHLHYTYDYFSSTYVQFVSVITSSSVDSGTVEYIVHDSALVNDSIIQWNVEVRRSILHRVIIPENVYDSTHWIYDTTSVSLTEATTGFHALTINSSIWQFPLANPVDTTPAYRFSPLSSDTISKLWYTGNLWGHDSLIFVVDLGLTLRSTSTATGLSYMTRTYNTTTIQLHESPVLSVRASSQNPNGFSLGQNYPNPFNPTTTIQYSVPTSQFIVLRLYDLLGREILVLDEGVRTPGTHSVVLQAHGLSSGIYFYQLSTARVAQAKKLMILK
jgi:hypothetical protein